MRYLRHLRSKASTYHLQLWRQIHRINSPKADQLQRILHYWLTTMMKLLYLTNQLAPSFEVIWRKLEAF
jgi:hypothetical protein